MPQSGKRSRTWQTSSARIWPAAKPAGLSISATNGDGSAAFVEVVDDALGGTPALTVNEWIQAAETQVAGSVYIVVEVSDVTGAFGKDSVKVDIS